MTQPDLFTYPNSPGYKRSGTSQEAAESIDATKLQALCLERLSRVSLTADEVADLLGMSVLTIRPRISELGTMGKIQPTGQRRKNRSGKSAIVWGRV